MRFSSGFGVTPSLKTKWFRRFQTGHFSVEDERREGRPDFYTDDVTDEDPRLTQEMIANELDLNAMAVSRILSNHLAYTKKSARWVPRIVNEVQKGARVHFAKFFLNKFKMVSLARTKITNKYKENLFY